MNQQKQKKVDKALDRLKDFYKTLPETKGCLEHIGKPRDEGGCGAWCCLVQQPSVLHVEFLLTWKFILATFEVDKIIDIIHVALQNYLSDVVNKGCIFFDHESSLCVQHESRPLACRQYAITPEEEFNKKLVKLRVLHKDKTDVFFRDQCNLVSTADGSTVTTKDTDKWWKELTSIEEDFGIKRKRITEEPGGTYRTYPEHILMKVFSSNMLDALQVLREFGSEQEKFMVITSYMEHVRAKLHKICHDPKNNSDS